MEDKGFNKLIRYVYVDEDNIQDTQKYQEQLIAFLDELTPTEKTIIEKRYGLYEDAVALVTLADELKLHREEIRKIEEKSLRKLRKMVKKDKKNRAKEKN